MKIWFPSVKANSGADVFVERLAAGLNNSGHEAVVTWFGHYHEFFPFLMGFVKAPNNTDIIHTNSWQTLAFSGSSTPLVMTYHHCVHDDLYKEFVSIFQDMYHKSLVFYYEKKGLEKADAAVFVSRYTSDTVARIFGSATRSVIYPAVDTTIFKPTQKKVANKKFRILYVGNTSARKGFNLLSKIMEKVDDSVELFYSTGMRGGNVSVAGNTHQVNLPTQKELVLAYQQCDAVIYPTLYEGFGYVACEAMACAKPIIASRCTSLTEVVNEGKTGVLCEPNDVDAFVEAIKTLSNDKTLCIELGEQGRKWVQKKFSMNRMVEEYITLYQSLLSN